MPSPMVTETAPLAPTETGVVSVMVLSVVLTVGLRITDVEFTDMSPAAMFDATPTESWKSMVIELDPEVRLPPEPT